MLRFTLSLFLFVSLILTALTAATYLFSPADAPVIAYTARGESTENDIVMTDIERGLHIPLIQSPGADFFPTWSPDGQQIMWQAYRNRARTVFIADGDGTNRRILNAEPSARDQHSPAWSPDGAQVVYAQQEANGLVQLYLHNLDTSNATRLTTDDYSAFMPVWSPDGTQIAFVHYVRYVDHVYRIDLASGSEVQPVTPGYNRRIVHLDWSPGSDALSYALNTNNLRQATLDGDSTALVNGSLGVYAPNDEQFAYVDRRARINLLDLTTDDTHILFDGITPNLSDIYITDLRWSPDGEWLAYTLQTVSATPSSIVYAIRADGSDHWRVSDPDMQSSSPDWRP